MIGESLYPDQLSGARLRNVRNVSVVVRRGGSCIVIFVLNSERHTMFPRSLPINGCKGCTVPLITSVYCSMSQVSRA